MNKALSLSPSEETLTRIETLLETIYDQVQELRDERSQAWFWTPEVQADIHKAEKDVEQGNTATFSSTEEMLAHFNSLEESGNAPSSKHQAI